MAKADKALAARRVDDILRIRLDGAEWWDVREFVREKEQKEGSAWFVADGGKPLSDAMIRKYQERADRLVWQSHEKSRKKLLRRHLAQRRNLYAKAVSQGDMRAALAVLRDEAQLLDLYPSSEAKLAAEVETLKRTLAEAPPRRGATDGDRGAEGRNPGAGGAGPGRDGAGADPPAEVERRPDAGDDGGGDGP